MNETEREARKEEFLIAKGFLQRHVVDVPDDVRYIIAHSHNRYILCWVFDIPCYYPATGMRKIKDDEFFKSVSLTTDENSIATIIRAVKLGVSNIITQETRVNSNRKEIVFKFFARVMLSLINDKTNSYGIPSSIWFCYQLLDVMKTIEIWSFLDGETICQLTTDMLLSIDCFHCDFCYQMTKLASSVLPPSQWFNIRQLITEQVPININDIHEHTVKLYARFLVDISKTTDIKISEKDAVRIAIHKFFTDKDYDPQKYKWIFDLPDLICKKKSDVSESAAFKMGVTVNDK